MKRLLSILFTLALCLPALAQTKSVVTPLATTSTDNGVPRYDGTTGQLLQTSGVTISDADVVAASGYTAGATNIVGSLAGKASAGNNSDILGLSGLTNQVVITRGTLTSSSPSLDISSTWNNAGVTFTGLKYNVTDTASAAASLLMDLQVGGSSRLSITKAGQLTGPVSGSFNIVAGSGNNLVLAGGSGGSVYVSTTQALTWGGDLLLYRDAAATLQMGADAATATAQTLKAHDGSGTDKDGANFSITGGQSTGTGRGGSVITRTSLTGSTGSSLNSQSTREYHNAKPVDLTESSATTIVTVAVAAGEYVSFDMYSTVFASDGTDHQALPTRLNVSAVNKAGTVTATITAIDGTTAASTGTLTCTYTAAASGNNVIVQANAVSSLTQTTLNAKWSINALNGNGTAAVTVP